MGIGRRRTREGAPAWRRSEGKGMERAAWHVFRILVLTKPQGHMFNSIARWDKGNSAEGTLHQRA